MEMTELSKIVICDAEPIIHLDELKQYFISRLIYSALPLVPKLEFSSLYISQKSSKVGWVE